MFTDIASLLFNRSSLSLEHLCKDSSLPLCFAGRPCATAYLRVLTLSPQADLAAAKEGGALQDSLQPHKGQQLEFNPPPAPPPTPRP
eukprot:9503509-Pyramimonas_sp.AAC.1